MANFDDEDLFVAIVDAGSFHQAAGRLKTSTSAVSRHLKKLEQNMGVQLLNRTTRSLSLTQPGRLFYESCRRIEAEKRTTQRLIQDLTANPVGKLTLTATPTFAQAHLMSALADFARDYPDISFQLTITDEQVDLVDSGTDVAIRIGALQDSRLRCRLLLRSCLVACASPGYLERHGRPTEFAGLAGHQFVYTSHLPDIERRQRERIPELVINEQQKRLEVNDVLSVYGAVRAGMGISLLPRYLVEADIASGALVDLFPGRISLPHDVYAVFHSSGFMPIKTRTFIDYLVARFSG